MQMFPILYKCYYLGSEFFEELFDIHSTPGTTGEEIFKSVEKSICPAEQLAKEKILVSLLMAVDKNKFLFGCLITVIENYGYLKPFIIHFIIYQQLYSEKV